MAPCLKRCAMSTGVALQPHRPWPISWRQDLQLPLLVALAYFLGAEAAFVVGTLSDKIFAPFWPPNVVLLCALLFSPVRRWWIFILAVLPAHVIAEIGVGMPMPQWLVAYVTNCMVAAGSAFAIVKILGGPPRFDSLRSTSIYIAIAAFVCPAVAAFGGAFVPILGDGPIGDYWVFWAQWYLSNALGAVTLGPIVIVVLNERFGLVSLGTVQRWLEAAMVALLLIAVCVVVFGFSAGRIETGFLPALLYTPLPFILWAAVRFGAKGASAAMLIITVVLIWQALNGPSLFVTRNPETSVFAIQAFLIGLAIPLLQLGASIDQARQAERSARDSEERMTFAAASADMCLWQFDFKSDVVWISNHGRQMFGFGSHEPVTRYSLINLIHPDDRQTALYSMLSSAPGGEFANNEFRIVRPDGCLRWIRGRARIHSDERNIPVQVTGTFVDVTDRKALDVEATEQRRELTHLMRVSMLGELSGGIAHELTQPLTAILSNAQAARVMMDGDPPNLPEVIAALDDIIEEDNRAGEVIHRLRGLLKKGESKFEPVDVNELVQSTLRLLHSELIGRRVKIDTMLSHSLPLVSGDAVQLQQVILNLVMNAMDAMNEITPSRRIISIVTRPTNREEIRISVADRGVGLPTSEQERLFQPFFTTKDRGLGLGLSICASIIRLHGGTMNLENNADGGAAAIVIIPVQSNLSKSGVAGGVS